jgi:hypothetical protein
MSNGAPPSITLSNNTGPRRQSPPLRASVRFALGFPLGGRGFLRQTRSISVMRSSRDGGLDRGEDGRTVSQVMLPGEGAQMLCSPPGPEKKGLGPPGGDPG